MQTKQNQLLPNIQDYRLTESKLQCACEMLQAAARCKHVLY